MVCEWGKMWIHEDRCTNNAVYEALYVIQGTEKHGNICREHADRVMNDRENGTIEKIWLTNIDLVPSYNNNKFTHDFVYMNAAIDLNRFVLDADHGQYKCMFCNLVDEQYVSFKNDIIRHLKLKHLEDISARLDYTVNDVRV